MSLPREADVLAILDKIRPSADYGWKGGEQNDITQVVWRDTVQVEPTSTEYDVGWALVSSERATKNNVRQQIVTGLASTEGRFVADLTTTEKDLLLEALVFNDRGLEKGTGLLKRSNEWIRKVEE